MTTNEQSGFPAGLEAEVTGAVQGWIARVHPQEFASLEEAWDFVNGVALTLVGVAARFAHEAPGPTRIDGHAFKKFAERCFKEAAQVPGKQG